MYSLFKAFLARLYKNGKRGLDTAGIGVVDIDLHACMHLEAVQAPPTTTLKQVKWKMKAVHVLDYCRTRFEIEFCYRDRKLFTELLQSCKVK